MKKLLTILLLASPAWAATWSVTTTAAQDARFQRDADKLNAATCVSVGLLAGCTQAQARNAFCAQPGSSGPAPCTVNGQPSGGVLIYSTLGEYLDKYVITAFFYPNLRQSQNVEDKNNFAKWLETASAAQKDAVCVAAGLAAGCLP